ncbi:U3 small nucleolar ribonucleoprotein lcp5 [Neofusicoccum parvum]|nr:U3 small nucleolar ribonucleoprotein lcp5 [Neofusicoccum parvum]
MAATKLDTSLPTLLSNLTASLTSAAETLPAQNEDAAAATTSFLPPKDGISLLDVKNELLLSYLQNLTFLILLKLRNSNTKSRKDSEEAEDDGGVEDEVVKKLCELRLYLEKGARPLEGKLKYQIDKVVRAADDAARAETAQKSGGAGVAKKSAKKSTADGSEDDSASDNSEGDDDEDDDEDDAAAGSDIDELAYRPNPLAFARSSTAADPTGKTKKPSHDASAAADDGIYRPPRITATSMPEHHLPRHGGPRDRDDDRAAGPRRAAAIDEFVDEHLSAAPVAAPSIGSNVVAGGRRIKSARERAQEEERRVYEETNFVRLPKAGKKERAQQARRDRGAFGGEEWRELGAGVDRIDRLTRKGEGSRGGAKGALERSRKRAVEDGPRASGGAEAGAMFAKRRKVASRRK